MKHPPAISNPTILLNSVSHALISTDHRGAIAVVNAPAIAILGGTRARIKGTLLRRTLRLLDPASRAPLPIPVPRSFSHDRKPRRHHHAILVALDGKEHLVDVTFSPLIDMWNHVTGSLVMLLDIGATFSRQRMAFNRELLETMGNMAGSTARDFSHWLNIISGHAAVITENLIPQTRAHEEASDLISATRKAGDLVKRLMNIAAVCDKKPQTVADKANLAEVVADAISFTQGTSAPDGISFNIRNIALMRPVHAEASQLLDCLVHLLRYSMAAMPEGGTITLSASRVQKKRKAIITLIIHHTGRTIPREEIGRVFDPFFSTSHTRSVDDLGLTIVKAAVGRWGGRITVQSRPKAGTTFRLVLPAVKEGPAKPATELSTVGETVLLADDTESCLQEATEWLQEAGYQIIQARSGAECLSLYEKHSDDIRLAILDVLMPGQNGDHVLHEILKRDPTLPMVLTSGFSRDYLRTYLPQGAWGFIQKPFDSSLFLTTIRRFIDQNDGRGKAVAS